jgi:5'-methylthioadenosine phosphorylase
VAPSEGVPGIIGGTGFRLTLDDGDPLRLRERQVETRWGPALVREGELGGRRFVFMDRHAHPDPDGTRLPPHAVNYRANIAALKSLGVTGILAVTAVGSLRAEWRPGTLVVPDQILDLTRRRPTTFFDDAAVHVDFTRPYCAHLRGQLLDLAREKDISVEAGGTYICTEGPRLESGAEIRTFRIWGADIVGMTAMPEAILAREAELSYAGISVVANPAAGTTPDPLTKEEVIAAMEEAMPRVSSLLLATAAAYRDDPSVPSRNATREYPAPPIDHP